MALYSSKGEEYEFDQALTDELILYDSSKCECDDEHLWYDEKLGIWRCRNCGWCN